MKRLSTNQPGRIGLIFNSKYLILPLLLLALTAKSQTNLEKYTPSILFGKGEWEINLFDNLYSQNSSRNTKGELLDLGQQQTFINSLTQFTFGVSDNARLNLGLDIMFTNAFYGKSSTSTGIQVSEGFHEFAVSGLGPRIKFSPVPSIPYFSVQSSLLFPVYLILRGRITTFTC